MWRQSRKRAAAEALAATLASVGLASVALIALRAVPGLLLPLRPPTNLTLVRAVSSQVLFGEAAELVWNRALLS